MVEGCIHPVVGVVAKPAIHRKRFRFMVLGIVVLNLVTCHAFGAGIEYGSLVALSALCYPRMASRKRISG